MGIYLAMSGVIYICSLILTCQSYQWVAGGEGVIGTIETHLRPFQEGWFGSESVRKG